jgi:hypothetical protein
MHAMGRERERIYNAPAFKVAEVLVWLSALAMIITTTVVRPKPAAKTRTLARAGKQH